MNNFTRWIFAISLAVILSVGLQGCDSHDHADDDHTEHDSHDDHGHDEKDSHDDHGHDEKDSHDDHGHDEKDSHDDHGHDEKDSHDDHGHDEKDSHDDHGHDEKDSHDDHGHGEEAHSVQLNEAQLNTADIKVTALQLREVHSIIQAPGEVLLNDYASSKATPRINAQIVTRHARLGDTVTRGQSLVTLSSVEMATAQGELLVAEREWQRVRKLGRKVVSESRYVQARIAREQARSKVLAYGMTDKQLDALLASGKLNQANGEFQLLAAQNGTVIRDHFIQGELVDAGTVLFEITDESSLWVDARLTPDQVRDIAIGSTVSVMYQDNNFPGKVIQIHHALDERTRTLGVRIAVQNPEDALHAGLFVNVKIETGQNKEVTAVPLDAVLRNPDGDWVVFIQHEDEFEPQEVQLIRTSGDVAVIEGVPLGTQVVTSGAFFLQSELAKSGFDIHNH